MTTTGMLVAASTPAGTSRVQVALWPGRAEAVPTVKGAWAFKNDGVRNRTASMERRMRIWCLREGMELNADVRFGQAEEEERIYTEGT
jgi:hypothetical protein